MATRNHSNHGYLLVASFDETTQGPFARNLLNRLVRALRPKANFSISINRQHGPALLCGFELKEDAEAVAASMKAKPIGKYDGWKSQWAFTLDARTAKKIQDVAEDAGWRPRAYRQLRPRGE